MSKLWRRVTYLPDRGFAVERDSEEILGDFLGLALAPSAVDRTREWVETQNTDPMGLAEVCSVASVDRENCETEFTPDEVRQIKACVDPWRVLRFPEQGPPDVVILERDELLELLRQALKMKDSRE